MYLSFANKSRSLHDLIDRQFDFLSQYEPRVESGKYQTKSTESAHTVQIALPGHDRESVKVSVDEGKLLISTSIDESQENGLTRSESFKFMLPKGCDTSSIDAQMSNGILTVTIAKELEKPKSKRIEISIN